MGLYETHIRPFLMRFSGALTASENGWTESGRATTVLDASTQLLAKSGGTGSTTNRYPYLKFTGTQAGPATLRIYLRDTPSVLATFQIERVGDGWSQSTLTFNNAPEVLGTLASAQIPAAPGYIDIPVTVPAGGTLSVRVAMTLVTSETYFFTSRGTATPPQLVYN